MIVFAFMYRVGERLCPSCKLLPVFPVSNAFPCWYWGLEMIPRRYGISHMLIGQEQVHCQLLSIINCWKNILMLLYNWWLSMRWIQGLFNPWNMIFTEASTMKTSPNTIDVFSTRSVIFCLYHSSKFKDNKGVTKSRKSKKDRQYNDCLQACFQIRILY
jgi:hypothetical protein